MDRDTAFRIADGAVRSQVDPRTGAVYQSELDILEQQRPEYADLTAKIREYLGNQLANCARRRRDEDAIRGLAESLRMAAGLLRVETSLSRDSGHGGVLESLRTSLLSLAATLLCEELPAPQSTRREVAHDAA
jgi:hypothetical protein